MGTASRLPWPGAAFGAFALGAALDPSAEVGRGGGEA